MRPGALVRYLAGGVLAGGAAGLGGTACGAGTRDVVPPSRDVVLDGGSGAAGPESYEYIARRSLAVVGLAEARGIEPTIARAAVDRIADAVDQCAGREGKKGEITRGAARLVAQIDAGGHVTGASLRLDPGGRARDAALCLVTPAQLLVFPPSDGPLRGIAVEAMWDPAGTQQ